MTRRVLILALAAFVACLPLDGCERDYPDRHIAKCELEWRASSENNKESWEENTAGFIHSCMSAADFSFNWGGQKCIDDPYESRCYKSRQSISYRIEKWKEPSLPDR